MKPFEDLHEEASRAKDSGYCSGCEYYRKYFERYARDYLANEILYLQKIDDINKGGGTYGHPETDFNTGYNQAIRDVIKLLK